MPPLVVRGGVLRVGAHRSGHKQILRIAPSLQHVNEIPALVDFEEAAGYAAAGFGQDCARVVLPTAVWHRHDTQAGDRPRLMAGPALRSRLAGERSQESHAGPFKSERTAGLAPLALRFREGNSRALLCATQVLVVAVVTGSGVL